MGSYMWRRFVLLEGEADGTEAGCALAGGLSKGLCYVNRKLQEAPSIQVSVAERQTVHCCTKRVSPMYVGACKKRCALLTRRSRRVIAVHNVELKVGGAPEQTKSDGE